MLSMYVCMYVFTYVCMYVCIYVRTYVCIKERAKRAHSLVMTFEIFHICVYVYIYICIYVRQTFSAHVLPAQQYLKINERETGTACGRNQAILQ